MNYENRKSAEAASIKKLEEVIKLGTQLGYWKALKSQDEEGQKSRFFDVITPDGLTFTLAGGSWGREESITASVGCANGPHGLKVSTSDVRTIGSPNRSASVNYKRDAEDIVKDLHRRVVSNRDAIDLAVKVRDRLALLVKQHSDLRSHIAEMEALGYDFPSVTERDAYSATGWTKSGKQPARIVVSHDGKVSFEYASSIDTFRRLLGEGRL